MAKRGTGAAAEGALSRRRTRGAWGRPKRKEVLFVMTKRLRQFKVASVLFVLALAAITFEGKPASAAIPKDSYFFIEYTASTLEAGEVSTKGRVLIYSGVPKT